MIRGLALAGTAGTVLFAAVGSAATAPGDFDRSWADEAARLPRPAARFLWTLPGQAPAPLYPLKAPERAEAVAREALNVNARRLAVPVPLLAEARLREVQDLGRGPVVVRFRQEFGGLPVFGRELNVMLDRDLRPVAISGSFAPHGKPAPGAGLPAFKLSEPGAVAAALADLAARAGVPDLRTFGSPPQVKAGFFVVSGRLVPAWGFAVRAGTGDRKGTLGYSYVVSAQDGAMLVRKNLVRDASFSYRAFADPVAPNAPDDGPLGNGRTPFPGADPYAPLARNPSNSQLISLQNGPIATNDPWLPDVALDTRGNNVDAYSDRNEPDGIGGDERAPLSGPYGFDYAATADANASSAEARRAGIVHLFYVNNYLHDLWYDHGFDEAAGNGQADNYGRGGVAGDPVLAESQDFSGTNNANMYTPPDGDSPVMQMYLFTGGFQASLTVNQPALGPLPFGVASFGPDTFDVTGDLVLVDDGIGPPADGCEFLDGVADKVALIDRGNCFFTDKARHAQAAGAIGVVIANNIAGEGAVNMGSEADDAVNIPVMSVSMEDGDSLKNALGGGTVNVTLQRGNGPARDSALDTGIVAHEFFHYVSNRLVGDGWGLDNNQGGGMGEGWSDFCSMLLAVRPDDVLSAGNGTFGGAYGLGLYVDDSAYFGVRRAPYSTDFSFNPLTFRHIEQGVPLPDTVPYAFGQEGFWNAEVHSTGEIWANVLWEVYAALLNDPRYGFDEARARMMDYVIAGLKMTPVSPTFLEARDGLLAAARATDPLDFERMAAAFAKRGMGGGAVAPDRYDWNNSGVVESYVGAAAAYRVEDVQFNFGFADGVRDCDHDGVLDPGETAQVSFSVAGDGFEPVPAGATIRLGSSGELTFPDGDVLTLPALEPGQSATVSAVVALTGAVGTAQSVTLTADFPEAGDSPDAVLEPPPLTRQIVVNHDLVRNRTVDDVEILEGTRADWGAYVSGGGDPWRTADLASDFGTGHMWWGADNSWSTLSTLTSPGFDVSGTFSLSFDHYFSFEPYFDGGVVEVSLDNGVWQDAVTGLGAVFTQGNGYNGYPFVFNGSPAFADSNGALESVTLDFGTALAGHSARLRFRLASDESVGAFGWVVDNIAFTGADAPVFLGPGPEDGVCTNDPPQAFAGANFAVDEGIEVTLSGSASDRDGPAGLSYSWARVTGPEVTLSDPGAAMTHFTAPQVDAVTPMLFRLTVSDGLAQATDYVVVTVRDTGTSTRTLLDRLGGGGGALDWTIGFGCVLALLRRIAGRRGSAGSLTR